MYDYISPEKVLCALRWLKQNNPLYADIDINEQWLEQALSNDEDLFGGLVEQCNTNDLNSDTDDTNSESVLPIILLFHHFYYLMLITRSLYSTMSCIQGIIIIFITTTNLNFRSCTVLSSSSPVIEASKLEVESQS